MKKDYNKTRSFRMDEKSYNKLEEIGKKQKPPLKRGQMLIKLIWDWVKKC